jgi:gliding motility-associated-like protein
MAVSIFRVAGWLNYFRTIAFFLNRTMKITVQLLSICAIMLLPFSVIAQNCSDALNNTLCADSPNPPDTLTTTPFSNACIDVSMSSFYSFHTNSVADAGSVNIAIEYVDCDYTTGGANDSIYVMVIPLPPNEDPCNPPFNINTVCFADSSNFNFDVYNLGTEQDYIVVVGSNHDPAFGPCEYTVNISGSAVDLVATVEPILVSLGESANLLVEGADLNQSINWTPPQFLDNSTSANPEVTAEETTAFQVSGFVGDCELTDIVTLTVGPPVEVYNTFTPNNDGINDTWRIKYIERFSNCQVEVFDRWGQSIFKSVGYAQPWDGTFRGRYLPTGPYYYVLELNSLEVTIPPILGVVSIVH